MGGYSYSPEEARSFRERHTRGRSAAEIFQAASMDPDFDPARIKTRECRASDVHPNPTPIIVGLDVTGSMDAVLRQIIDESLVDTINHIYEQKPVSSPQVMIMGIGDSTCDEAPLQMTQFEADIRILEQLKRLYVERGGGGNHGESYPLAWMAAAQMTSCDSLLENPPRKGYLFTIGDEPPLTDISAEEIREVFGPRFGLNGATAQQLYRAAARSFHVYHLIIEEGNYASHYPKETMKAWRRLIGRNAIGVADYREIAGVIVSIIQMVDGRKTLSEIDELWSGTSTQAVVRKALTGSVPALPEPEGLLRRIGRAISFKP
ncbi:hypothetical protein C4J81_12085 [Deltaproteobacteria bacterium Smac51]|nr:hypothetical protein C4J81_12085 [Deltaproteobacteria bacterium Smac51]